MALKVVPKAGQATKIIAEQAIMRALAESDDNYPYLLPLLASWHDTDNFYVLSVSFS